MIATAPASALSRLRRTFTSLGLLNGLLYLADRLLGRLSRGQIRVIKYLLVAQPIGSASALGLRRGGSMRIESADADHPMVADFPRPASVIAMRYAHGARCLVASVKDQFAGYLWWQRHHYDEDEVRCRYLLAQPEISVWDFDVYVAPRFRFGRTLALLWQAAEGCLQQDGVQWSFSRISAFNADSLAAHSRLHAGVRARAVFLVVGSLQIGLFDQSPYLHLSMSHSGRPVLRLTPPADPLSAH